MCLSENEWPLKKFFLLHAILWKKENFQLTGTTLFLTLSWEPEWSGLCLRLYSSHPITMGGLDFIWLSSSSSSFFGFLNKERILKFIFQITEKTPTEALNTNILFFFFFFRKEKKKEKGLLGPAAPMSTLRVGSCWTWNGFGSSVWIFSSFVRVSF